MKVYFAIISLVVITEASIILDNTSCVGRCNQTGADPGAPCQCNKPCVGFGDCCADFQDVCGNQYPITDEEIAALTEELYVLEGPNNAYQYINVSSDHFTVDPAAYELDTIKKLVALYDNYSPEVCTPEIFTSEQEEQLNDFIDGVYASPIMQRTKEFLESKGLPFGRESFVQIWMDQYSRCAGIQGSSGFENVFMMELPSEGLSGLDNWIFFAKAAEAGDVGNITTSEYFKFGKKGEIIEVAYSWLGQRLPIRLMIIGTSPELELALYTIAYYARPNSKCPVSLDGTKIQIQTYNFTFNGLKYVTSAYPES